MLGKMEGRRRGQQRMRWLDGIINSVEISLSTEELMFSNSSPEVVLEKTLESPLDSKEIKPVNPKGNQL